MKKLIKLSQKEILHRIMESKRLREKFNSYIDDGDVTARSIYGKEFSIQEEGTIDGLMELLYYIEESVFEIVKD